MITIKTEVTFITEDSEIIRNLILTYSELEYYSLFVTNESLGETIEWYIALGEECDD